MATISLIEKNEQGTKLQNDCNILKTVVFLMKQVVCPMNLTVVMVNHMT